MLLIIFFLILFNFFRIFAIGLIKEKGEFGFFLACVYSSILPCRCLWSFSKHNKASTIATTITTMIIAITAVYRVVVETPEVVVTCVVVVVLPLQSL